MDQDYHVSTTFTSVGGIFVYVYELKLLDLLVQTYQ